MATTSLDKSHQMDFSGLAFLVTDIVASGSIYVGGNALSAAELGFVDGVTAGTATASKALVLGASKEIATITSLTATTFAGTPNFSGAVTMASTLATTGAITPTGGIAAAGGFSVTPWFHTGATAAMAAADGTDSTPSTTETYYAAVHIPCNTTLTGAAIMNGSAVGTDKLIYILWNSAGTVVANTALAGTTATGTDAYQKIAFTATYAAVGPATYFLGVQVNGTTYRYNAHPLGVWGADKKTATTFGTAPTITPPTAFVGTSPIMTLY